MLEFPAILHVKIYGDTQAIHLRQCVLENMHCVLWAVRVSCRLEGIQRLAAWAFMSLEPNSLLADMKIEGTISQLNLPDPGEILVERPGKEHNICHVTFALRLQN
jgi:hypothetical protein